MEKETYYFQKISQSFNFEAAPFGKQDVKSDNYLQYEQILLSNLSINKEQLIKMLSQSDIKLYDEGTTQKNQKNFRIVQIKSTSSAFVYQFIVSIYPFYTTLLILFQQQKSPFQSCQVYSFGNCGRIYLAYNEQKYQPFIIKEILFQKSQNWNQIFLGCLKQYMLALIMSALQVGPKIKKNFGFDIVVFSQTIIFEMEYCLPKKFNKQAENDLKRNLAILHSFNIVHLDIKPMNIAFSNEFSKWIFIDFGFTEVVEQKVGYKTKTRYIGTFSFSSDEMKNCILGSNYVDLYYNDAFSLQQTISYFQKTDVNLENSNSLSLSVMELNERQIQRSLIEARNKIMLKYYIYKQDIKILKKYFQQFGNQQLSIVAAHFMSQSFPSINLRYFFYDFLTDKVLNSQIKCYLDHKFKTNLKLDFEQPAKWSLQQKNSSIQSLNRNILKNKSLFIQLGESMDSIFLNIEKIKIDKKKILTNQAYISSIQQDLYVKLVFKYITFQQNLFQVQLEDKQEVARFFNKKYQLEEKNYLGYEIQVPELLSIVVCLKFIISYCQKQPYNLMKINMYPEVCTEFVLLNPSIFSAIHPFNYFKYWSREIYKQNHGNLFRMLVNLLKIYSGFSLTHYRNGEINYNQNQIYNIYTALQDVWNNDDYLQKHLKDKKNIQNLRILIKNIGLFTHFQKKNQILSFLVSLVNDEFFEKSEQFQFHSKIRIGKCFLKFWDCNEKSETYKIISQIYSNLNIQTLSEQLFHLCICFQSVHDVFNCKQILNKIDKIINCPLISDRYLFMSRLYTNQFQENKQKIVDYVQLQIKCIKSSQSKNIRFYCELIQAINFILCWPNKRKTKNNKTFYQYQNKNQKNQSDQVISLRIQQMNIEYIQKMKKVVHNMMSKVQNSKINEQNLLEKTYFQLSQLLKCILSYIIGNNQDMVFAYDSIQKLHHKISKQVVSKNQKLIDLISQLRIFSISRSFFLKKQYFKNVQFLYEMLNSKNINFSVNIEDDDQKNQKKFQLFLIYVKNYHFFIHLQMNKKTSQDTCSKSFLSKDYSNYNKNQLIKTTQSQQLIKIYQKFYEDLLNYLYLKLIKYNNFSQTLRYDSPNVQILEYFYIQKQYKKFFHFLYVFTKYINTCPNSVNIYQTIEILLVFRHFNQNLCDQFLNQFEHSHYNKLKSWINPYWWVAASFITTWSNKCIKKTLVKIAKSTNYMIFYGKHQILKTLYVNCILLYIQKLPILKRINLINQPRKVLYLLKKHFKYYTQKKVKIQQIEAVKCPKHGFLIFHKQLSKKIAIYHSNIQNVKSSK